LFTTPTAASEAVNKLHAHVFKGCLLSVTLKKRLDTLSKPIPSKLSEAASEGQKPTTAAPSTANRLIVRNLPFEATEQDLRAVFLPYGPIYSIHIPKAEQDGNGEGKKERTKGFAFVWMLSKKDAEKAIEGCNGIVVRAGTADSIVSDKQKKKKQKREEKKLKAAATGDSAGDEADELVEDKRATVRTIAVDWALSKEKWKEEMAKIEETAEDVDVEDASSSEASAQDSDQDGEDSDDDGELGVHNDESGDSEEDEDNDENEDEDMEEPVKPTLPPPETGTTLFVRNVPFQATEDELRTL
jgi:nucleolar protein 4